jgi:hypothetical protein
MKDLYKKLGNSQLADLFLFVLLGSQELVKNGEWWLAG